MASISEKVKVGGALAYDGLNYVYAMNGEKSDPTEFYRYNTVTDSWSQMADLPVKVRAGGALIYFQGKIYALQGGDSQGFFEYNVATNSWTTKALPPGKIKLGGALTEDGIYLYAINGEKTDPSSFYRYDDATDTWSTMANFPAKAKGGGALISVGASGIGERQLTFTQIDPMCSSLTLAGGGTVALTLYINVLNGTMPTFPNIDVDLKYGGTTFYSFPSATHSGGILTYTGTPAR